MMLQVLLRKPHRCVLNCLIGLRRMKKRSWSQKNFNISETDSFDFRPQTYQLMSIFTHISDECDVQEVGTVWNCEPDSNKISKYETTTSVVTQAECVGDNSVHAQTKTTSQLFPTRHRYCLEHDGCCSHELRFGKLKWICGKLLKMVCYSQGSPSTSCCYSSNTDSHPAALMRAVFIQTPVSAHLSDPVRAGAGGKRHVSDPSLLFDGRK